MENKLKELNNLIYNWCKANGREIGITAIHVDTQTTTIIATDRVGDLKFWKNKVYKFSHEQTMSDDNA